MNVLRSHAPRHKVPTIHSLVRRVLAGVIVSLVLLGAASELAVAGADGGQDYGGVVISVEITPLATPPESQCRTAAACTAGQLPETGFEALTAAAGVLLLLGGALAYGVSARRRPPQGGAPRSET